MIKLYAIHILVPIHFTVDFPKAVSCYNTYANFATLIIFASELLKLKPSAATNNDYTQKMFAIFRK